MTIEPIVFRSFADGHIELVGDWPEHVMFAQVLLVDDSMISYDGDVLEIRPNAYQQARYRVVREHPLERAVEFTLEYSTQ